VEKKKEGYSGSTGEGFIPYMIIFWYWGIGKLVKLLILCKFEKEEGNGRFEEEEEKRSPS
jgi:hypothetical protein